MFREGTEMADTIFFTLKLKRGKTSEELFEKMRKSVKPKGATKNWICEVDGNSGIFSINFNDEKSEAFVLSFDEKKVCEGFCKVDFLLEGDDFNDEKKSEFKAFMNMLYSARTFFSKMEISDDYGITASFLDRKKYKITLRMLNSQEIERAERIFNNGHTELREFIIALLFDLRGLDFVEDYKSSINMNAASAGSVERYEKEYQAFGFANESFLFGAFVDSFLYETAEYQNKGLLRKTQEYFDSYFNIVLFSVSAFQIGVVQLIGMDHFRAADDKSGQVLKLYEHSFLAAYNEEKDDFNKCVLGYRYFISIYDYLGFKYAGT
ncbi:MAG: hypothetical protein K2N29_04640 [Ruminiclostridium sp.]|nr:hypothetical protein [Ruminiclostridium sp.]